MPDVSVLKMYNVYTLPDCVILLMSEDLAAVCHLSILSYTRELFEDRGRLFELLTMTESTAANIGSM